MQTPLREDLHLLERPGYGVSEESLLSHRANTGAVVGPTLRTRTSSSETQSSSRGRTASFRGPALAPSALAARNRRASLSHSRADHFQFQASDLHMRPGKGAMLAEGESYRDRGSSDNVRLIVSDGNGDAEDDKLKRKVFSPRGLRRFSLQALRLHAERVGPAKLLACGASVVCVILVFLMWLYPEYIGSDIPTLVFGGRTCMVLDSFNIEVAGNANRMDSLIIAAELSRSKGYDYLAVDDVWQAWMCKVYSDESIDNLKAIIPVIPLSKPYTSENCVAFARMYQSGQVKKLEDTCETGWSHSSFYRYPWHHKAPGELFPFGDWRYLAPTGKGALDATLARLETIRSAHRGKKIVAVHRRWLSRSCVKPIQLSELDKYDEYEKYCHLTPDMVRSYLSQSGISEDEAHVIVSTDGLVPEEDALFSMWQIESEDIPFMQQVWLWVYADVFIGNPKSTIDQAACRWRTLYCKDCLPCLPQDLFVRAHTGFKQGSVPVHVP